MKLFSKKNSLALIITLVVFCIATLSLTESKREERIVFAFHSYLEKHSTEMLAVLNDFKKNSSVEGDWDSSKIITLQKKFLELRIAYKKIEPFSCYYFSSSGRNFNGPLVTEIEDEDEEHPTEERPHGLQQMEAYLWTKYPQKFKEELQSEIELLNQNLSALSEASKTLPTDEARFIEAIQLQVIRTFTLGITQFDTPKCKNSLEEARTTIQSLVEMISAAYQSEKRSPYVVEVLKKLNRTLSYLNKTTSIDALDFLSLFREFYFPLSKSLAGLRSNFVEKNYYPPSALKFDAPSLFETTAFNRFFYNPRGTDPKFSNDAADLGKALFFDPVLSENNKRACASCHQPERAFTDGMKTSSGFLEGEKLKRNAPTIINAAVQRNYFYDMRADHLEGQIGHVLANKKEMQSSFESAIKKLNTSPEYVEWFKRAFHGKEDTVISKTSIENAISEYERTLVSLNSKFDKNVRGEEQSFTKEEKIGFNVFMNKGRCATCHYLPLFNNVVPPEYTRSEFEIIGTPESSDTLHPKLDPDSGRGGLYRTKIFTSAFKTPTLRNISLTAPYMHNGAFQTLEQVIDFYNKGGGAGIGLDIPNQTLITDSLHLSEKEKKSLIAFLNTLTDTMNLSSKPRLLPLFSDRTLNKRKIGGEY